MLIERYQCRIGGNYLFFDAQSAGEVFVTVQYHNPGGTEWQKPILKRQAACVHFRVTI